MKLSGKFFQDNTGKYVTGQPPNIPVYIIIASFLILQLFSGHAGWMTTIEKGAEFILRSTIFLWSYLEILYGESMFRKTIGGISMALLLIWVTS